MRQESSIAQYDALVSDLQTRYGGEYTIGGDICRAWLNFQTNPLHTILCPGCSQAFWAATVIAAGVLLDGGHPLARHYIGVWENATPNLDTDADEAIVKIFREKRQ